MTIYFVNLWVGFWGKLFGAVASAALSTGSRGCLQNRDDQDRDPLRGRPVEGGGALPGEGLGAEGCEGPRRSRLYIWPLLGNEHPGERLAKGQSLRLSPSLASS